MTKSKKLIETKVYTSNDTEFYELLPQEFNALDYLSKTKQGVEEYTGVMPVEVQKVVEFAKPLMWDLQVWEVIATPDPFLVGIVPSKVYLSNVPRGMKSVLTNYRSVTLERANEITKEYPDKVKKSDWQMSTVDGAIRYYLLAQWGRELKKLSRLVEIAKQKYLVENKRKLMEQRLEAENSHVRFGSRRKVWSCILVN